MSRLVASFCTPEELSDDCETKTEPTSAEVYISIFGTNLVVTLEIESINLVARYGFIWLARGNINKYQAVG